MEGTKDRNILEVHLKEKKKTEIDNDFHNDTKTYMGKGKRIITLVLVS